MAWGRWTAAACAIFCALALPATGEATDAWAQFGFLWPALGTVTTPFSSYHPGIDIGSLRSLTVRSATTGTVELVGRPTGYEGYGNVVVVMVAPGELAVYAHLASWSVKLGERVLPSEPIGIAGCTGICTGTHLHFEVRLDGSAVDPMRFLS